MRLQELHLTRGFSVIIHGARLIQRLHLRGHLWSLILVYATLQNTQNPRLPTAARRFRIGSK